jgi:hypothetical protein
MYALCQQMGWAGLKNGELLRQAARRTTFWLPEIKIWNTNKTLAVYLSPLSFSLR